MMIFNSLGSNYNFGFALRALFAGGGRKYRNKLMECLRKKYGGEVFLTYKGREAIRLALRAIVARGGGGKKGQKRSVAICGFTCYAVYEACVKEGMDVEYLDIERETLNFSFETLRKRCEENSKIGVVMIQNTLGIACDIEKISDFCKRRGIILVEDLAHSVGVVYEDGRVAGTVGDFVALSFSQDKMIDGVSGGALIIRNKSFRAENKDRNKEFANVPVQQQLKDRFYPLFTWIIRSMYGVGVGKVVHVVLRKFNLLSKPMSGSKSDIIYGLPNWYCYLIYLQFGRLKDDLVHRRRIAGVYAGKLNEPEINNSVNLRFPILVAGRDGFIRYLKKRGVFVSDIWYDAPIGPKRFLKMTDYKAGMCSKSEEVSELVLNLPTHRNVSEEDARRIGGVINGLKIPDKPE